MTIQTLISGGLISGVFAVLVALAVGLFNKSKNNADATNAIVGGAKVVVDMNVEELIRKDAKIVALHGRINRLRAFIRDLIARMEVYDLDVPPLPAAFDFTDEDPADEEAQ